MRRLLFPLLATLALAGCSSKDDEPAHVPTIHIEASESSRLFGREIEMPVSKQRCPIIAQPVVPEGNFLATEIYEVGDPLMRRKVLLVQIDGKAAANVYNITMKARDKRLFLMVNNEPVGFHLVADPVRGGDIFFDLEIPAETGVDHDRAVEKLRNDLNESILKIRKAKEKKN